MDRTDPRTFTRRFVEETVAMVTRGFAESDIRKIIGENYLRVAGAIMDKKPRGPLI